jgi:N-acetylmuramoyl-L-alanine amidase
MRNIIGLTVLFTAIASSVSAAPSLYISHPPANYQTTSEKFFLIGTAPPGGEVLINGKPIARSSAGHFAPSLPLQLGDNLFVIRYQGQQIPVKVKRLPTETEVPKELGFAKNSLTPGVDVARQPGELVCFGAIAPPNANVSIQLGNQTVPLMPQQQIVQLPPNSGALTNQNQPYTVAKPGQYLGCASSDTPGELGKPEFQVSQDGKRVSQTSPGRVSIITPSQLEVAEVIVDSGIARTGPSTDYSRLTPLPKGTRATITGKEGEWLRLDYGGWINGKEVKISPSAVPPRSIIRSVQAKQVNGSTEVTFPLQVPVPMTVQQGDRTLVLTLYNTTAQTDIIRFDDDPVISRLDWQQVAPGQVQYTFNLKTQQQWGYKLEYRGTSLVMSLRHPPVTPPQSGKPLTGIKIVLDAGHGGTETGAQGPTGYPEKDVNLIVTKLLANQLVARGATVYLTREEDKNLSLPERTAIIDRLEPAIAISIHYNSLPDEGDAFNTKGFGAFWYHPQAHGLAVFLHNYVVKKMNRPSYGVFWDNLALVRPATAPSVLLELGFMSNPFEFEWVVNPQEQQKLAVILADGITQWFAVTR